MGHNERIIYRSSTKIIVSVCVYILSQSKNMKFQRHLIFTKRKMLTVKGCLVLTCLISFSHFAAAGKKLSRGGSSQAGGGVLTQSFLREPFDQIAAVGEHVTLPCRVINKRGVLQWTRDDFGLGSERQLIGFDRYQMTGSDEEGKKTDLIFGAYKDFHVTKRKVISCISNDTMTLTHEYS